jgi:hypothetical protein
MLFLCSFAEQQAVESCFLEKGSLLPTFHKFYWMGLRTGMVAQEGATLSNLKHMHILLPTGSANLTLTQSVMASAGVEGAKWPNFTFVDRRTVIYNGTYQHWGVLQPGNILEPNNRVPPENCAGGNLTMGIRPADKAPVIFDGAAGWADHNCGEQYISMCRVTREVRRITARPPLPTPHSRGC